MDFRLEWNSCCIPVVLLVIRVIESSRKADTLGNESRKEGFRCVTNESKSLCVSESKSLCVSESCNSIEVGVGRYVKCE
jgi:hypothetical protein